MNAQGVQIAESVERILATIPENVTLLAAAKTRSLEEVQAVIGAGVTHIGYNYIQEALPIIQAIGHRATWHMIGHLQTNKSRLAVHFFDKIQTVDSWRIARILDRHCADAGKIMSVLVEINSGREPDKTGIMPEKIEAFVQRMMALDHLQVEGLMTMGPRFGDPQDSRPYFIATRQAFERIAAMNLPNVNMQTLSMGMSNSYRIAIEEGATMVRIGTRLFGAR